MYPFAISLKEAIRTYESVLRKIEERPGVLPLLAQLRKDVHETIREGFSILTFFEVFKILRYKN